MWCVCVCVQDDDEDSEAEEAGEEDAMSEDEYKPGR
jgi:hypothetical protein